MSRRIRLTWQQMLLMVILALSVFFSFWALSKEGYSNEYYAAAVKSMLQSPEGLFLRQF